MSEFSDFLDLASERVGGRVLAANDDFFAPKENLIKAAKPIWLEDKYSDRGKWMDGWESRRRRTPGHDWCILQLGISGVISQIVVDTSYFRGNFPESCSLEACAIEQSNVDLAGGTPWTELLSRSQLQGDSQNTFTITDPHRYTHVRLNIYPDGGVARLRVFGEAVPKLERALNSADLNDLAALTNGGRVLDCSDRFFSAPQNLLMPDPSSGMHDGWETKRRRGPGHDWVIIQLGVAGAVQAIEVDTSYFKGNFPESCSLEICAHESRASDLANCSWSELLSRTSLSADSVHRFQVEGQMIATHVRFNIYPDGGVARLRVYGVPQKCALTKARLRWLNALPDYAASSVLLNCCGSLKWAVAMTEHRPFADLKQLTDQHAASCERMTPDDWKEAFASHPQIGEEKESISSGQARRWSQQEQSRAAVASLQVRNALQRRNQEYYERFGYIFIVCASEKSAEEILELLTDRLSNDAARELQVAAGEQKKITQLRLQKLIEA